MLDNARKSDDPEVKLQQAYETITQYLIEVGGYNTDVDRSNLKETPKRAAKGFRELFMSLNDIYAEIKKHTNKAFPATPSDCRPMEFVRGIYAPGLCPHHLLPISYDVTVQFDVSDTSRLLGLSKYARIIKLMAKRPVLQEQLARELGDLFTTGWTPRKMLEPISLHMKGVIVAMKGKHACASCRGISERNFEMCSIVTLGSLKDGLNNFLAVDSGF